MPKKLVEVDTNSIPFRDGNSASRLLKKAPNFVLGSPKSSTYPRGYASGFDSPAALLDGLFEQPARSDLLSSKLANKHFKRQRMMLFFCGLTTYRFPLCHSG